MHCRRFRPNPMSRRELLQQSANGFGSVALAALLADPAFAGLVSGDSSNKTPLAPRKSHFPAKAKSVIFLFMDGGLVELHAVLRVS